MIILLNVSAPESPVFRHRLMSGLRFRIGLSPASNLTNGKFPM